MSHESEVIVDLPEASESMQSADVPVALPDLSRLGELGEEFEQRFAAFTKVNTEEEVGWAG